MSLFSESHRPKITIGDPKELEKMIADDEKKAAVARVTAPPLEHAEPPLSRPHAMPVDLQPKLRVVTACLVLGALCVVSAIAKTWLGVPSSYDWFLLGAGVVLCGMSLFRKFSFGATGFEGEMKLFGSKDVVSSDEKKRG